MKKISVTVVLVAALMVTTAAAFAAANWTGIAEFLGSVVGGWSVNDEAIVTPVIRSNTSQWLNLESTEAYWAEDGLLIVLRVDAADDRHIVCYSNEDGLLNEEGEMSGQIAIGGEIIPLDQWRGQRELIVTEYLPMGEGWNWYKRTDEGLFVIVTSSNPEAEKLEKGTDVSLQMISTNIQTGETEDSTVTITLPAMTMQEGHQ